MRIKWLEFEYFLCFGPKVRLDFTPEFNVLITGQWHNQKHRSNWSGKSSLLEVIKFLLYGETRSKYNKEIPNDNFDKAAKVSGAIEIDGKEYVIHREASRSSTKLEIEGESSVDKKNLQARLNQRFGYSYSDFVSTCFFNQGEIHQFMEAKSTEKLLLLERWMEILSWDESERLVKEKKKWVEDKVRDIEELVEELPSIKESLQEINKSIETVEKKLEELKSGEAELASQIEKTKLKMAQKYNVKDLLEQKKDIEGKLFGFGNVAQVEGEVKLIESEIQELKRSLEKNNAHVGNLSDELKEKMELWKEAEIIRNKVSKRKIVMEKIKDRVSRIGESYSCPIDGEDCTRVKEIKVFMKEQKRKLGIASKELMSLEAKLMKLESAANKLELSVTEKRRMISQMEKTELKIETLTEKLKRVQSKLNIVRELESKLKELKQLTSLTKDKARRKMESVIEELEELDKEVRKDLQVKAIRLGELHQQRKIKRARLKRIRVEKNKIDKLNKRKEVLSFCALMFGKRGIRSSQLRGRIDNIEHETNLMLDELDSKLQIEIHTDRELGSWEPICIYCGKEFPKGYAKNKCDNCRNYRAKRKKDEFDIKIINNGKVRSFNQESGGVKILVSLAIRLSIVKLRQRITGKSIDLLFLDEVYGMLDSVNRERVYRFLLDYARNELGFKQIFQVSHMNDGFDEGARIEIIKRRRYSEVKWA